jgi:lysophospholipid acyltransferase (LPLAT)-like uncharacterized protein
MKITSPFFQRLGGLLASSAVRNWMSTLEYKAAFYDRSVDPMDENYSGQKIYIFWHEYILFPLYLRGNNNFVMLLSPHRDAEILSRTAHHMGFDCVRGSTYRGGAAALRELMQKSRGMNLTITPDGPRGPRRTLAQGPIYLASKLGLPIVATGFGYDRPWRMRSWDRFALPRPFSRARAVVSPAISLPTDLDRHGVEYYRQRVEHLLNRLTIEAEAWAEAGTCKVNEVEIRRQPSPHGRIALKTIHRTTGRRSSERPAAPSVDPREYPRRRAA